MIPVLFDGRIVGWMPPVCVPKHLPVYQVPIFRPKRMPSVLPEDSSPVDFLTVELRVINKDANGRPGEFHVSTLRGLLSISTFQPEDAALPDLTAAVPKW